MLIEFVTWLTRQYKGRLLCLGTTSVKSAENFVSSVQNNFGMGHMFATQILVSVLYIFCVP